MMRSTFVPSASVSWSSDEIQRMRVLAAQGVSLETMSGLLRRTPSAIRNKAALHGISLAGRKRANLTPSAQVP